jgi:hypothetical protein
LGFRWGRKIVRRLSRITELFPYHAIAKNRAT